jgi:hypothetical protein
MVLKCEDVLLKISNYFDEDLDSELKRAMEEHFAQCRHCKALHDGMRNVIEVYGDERMYPLPAGFHSRLRHRLADRVEGPKGSALGWLVTFAGACALASFAIFATVHNRLAPQPRAQMSQPARRMPQRLVAVVEGGKTFHVPGCPFMHGKYHLVTPQEAIREGYGPCDRCMYEALQSAGTVAPEFEGEEFTNEWTPQNELGTRAAGR